MQLNPDDILSLQEAALSPTETKTFEVGELKSVIAQRLGAIPPDWFATGIPCKCLSASQGKWTEGMVTISIEFSPGTMPVGGSTENRTIPTPPEPGIGVAPGTTPGPATA